MVTWFFVAITFYDGGSGHALFGKEHQLRDAVEAYPAGMSVEKHRSNQSLVFAQVSFL